MNIDIKDDIWLSTELGVLDKTIIIESLRTGLKEVDDEFVGHQILFTRCKQENVIRSINKLIDLKLLTGNKIVEIKKIDVHKTEDKQSKPVFVDENTVLDTFIKKYKEVVKKRYFEIAQKDSILISDEAMKLTISCFKNNHKRYELYSTISDNNLIAIFDMAVKIKKKEVGYDYINNPFAYVNNAINKCIYK